MSRLLTVSNERGPLPDDFRERQDNLPLAIPSASMNEGSPDRPGPQASALDSPSPFKFPNKSAVEEQGVIKLRSQGRKSASVAKAEDTSSTDRTPSATNQRSPRFSQPELQSSPSAVLSEMPALPLPSDSRPKITIKKMDSSSARARADHVSDTDSDCTDRPATLAGTATPRRVSMQSVTAPLSSSKKMKRFRRKLGDCLFTVPEADIPTLASMASPLHQRIVFVNPPATIFDNYDEISSYDRDNIESWTSPPPMPFVPHPPTKNSLPSWVHACSDAVEALMKMPGARDFATPVNATALGLHDYFDVIKNPMDLGTIKSKLMSRVYSDAAEFCDDVRLTFSNCVLYNSLESPIGAKASKMWNMFCSRWFSVIKGFTPGMNVPYAADQPVTEGIMSSTWFEEKPTVVVGMRELYWTCVLGNEGQCIGPDEIEQHTEHVIYGFLKKENEKPVPTAPLALRNVLDVRFEGYDWLNECHPTCPGRKAILRFWVQGADSYWYRLSTPAPSYFPTYWLAVRRNLIVSRALLCLSMFPNVAFDDFMAMMQSRYTPPSVKSTAKGPQAVAQQKIVADWKSISCLQSSVCIFPAPAPDEVVAMITGLLKGPCYNVNSKFNVSSNPACSVAERKFKQLLKKLSEIDSFPPPDVVELNMDILAEPEDRSGSRASSKSSKHDGDESQMKEKKKRGRKKGSTFPSEKSKKGDGESSKRRKTDESAEGSSRKKRKRRSGSEDKDEKSNEEKSPKPGEGEKRKRDRKAEKERRDALKLAEFGGSISEVKLTDEQRRERDALAYKPKFPLEKLSEETRLRHEELSQALRQQFVSASRADNETRRQVAGVISSIIANIERRDETEKRSEERRRKLIELKIQQQLQHDDVKVQKEIRGVLADMCTDVESIHKKREELESNCVGWCDDLYIAQNWGADFVARSHAVQNCSLSLRGKAPPSYPFGQPSGPSNTSSIDTLCSAISSFMQFLRRLLSPKSHDVVQQEDLLRLPPARPEDVRSAVISTAQPPVWWAEVHMLALRVLYDERQLNLGDPLLAEVPVTPLTWPTMTSLAVLNMRDEMHGRVGDDLRAAADVILLKGYGAVTPLQRCTLIMFLFDCLIETDRFADYFLCNRDTVISQQEASIPIQMFDSQADRRESFGAHFLTGSGDSPVVSGERVSKQPPQLLAWWSNRLYVKFAELFPEYSPVNLSNLRGSPIASGALQALPIGEYVPLGMDRFYDQYWATRDTSGELRVLILRQERSGSELVATVSANSHKDLLHIGISVNAEDCATAATFSLSSKPPFSSEPRPSKKSSQAAPLPHKVVDHPGSTSGSMWTIDALNEMRRLESWLLPTGYREGSLKAAMRDVIEAKLTATPHPVRVSVSSGDFLLGNWPLQRAEANGSDVAAVLDLIPPILLSFGEPSGGGGCSCLPKLTSSHKLAECIEVISQLPTAVLCDNLPAEWRPRRGREEEGGHLSDWFDAIANCTSIGELMLYVDLFATMVVNVNAPHIPETIPSVMLWCKGFSGCSYIPAVDDDVMYSRTGHIRHLNVLKRQPWDVPVDLRSKTGLVRTRVLQDATPGVSGLPKEHIVRCTVEAVDLCKSPDSKLPNFARVVLRVSGTERRLLLTYHLGVALPDFIIPYKVYSAIPFCCDDLCGTADPLKVFCVALWGIPSCCRSTRNRIFTAARAFMLAYTTSPCTHAPQVICRGSRVTAWFLDASQMCEVQFAGTVLAVNKGDPHESVNVEWDVDGTADAISPWELQLEEQEVYKYANVPRVLFGVVTNGEAIAAAANEANGQRITHDNFASVPKRVWADVVRKLGVNMNSRNAAADLLCASYIRLGCLACACD